MTKLVDVMGGFCGMATPEHSTSSATDAPHDTRLIKRLFPARVVFRL